MTVKTYPWWKDSTIYQIWPASFRDSNGDGFGDIPGIIKSLDHIKSLGASVVWLSPHYDSPQDDMGYDISNYEAIYEKYGTMDDMNQLIEEVHKRGLKLVCDLVINHTSSEHAWFKESKSSLDNPKRDWYIWRKPRYDDKGNRLPPTNWLSHFSGSAWNYDETTDEYYLCLFAKTQPDLNWENEETRNAIYKSALEFWFKKGVDGFRIDTAGMYSKKFAKDGKSFEDAPIVFPEQYYQPSSDFTTNGPRIHEFHKEMFEKVTSNYDVLTVGEVGHCSKEEALKYVSANEKEMNMMFLFDVVDVGSDKQDRFRYNGFTLKDFKDAVAAQSDFIKGTDAWSTVFIENHDQPRAVTRFGNTSNKQLWAKSAKLLALLQTTLTGTLYIYQGQEIGMTNLPRSWDIEEYKDINTINYWAQYKEKTPNDPEADKKLLDVINLVARDHARSPVQWDDSANGGFSTGTPWTRVNDNYKEINVKAQTGDPDSVFSFYQNAIKVRQLHKELFIHGDFEILDYENDKLFTYVKSSADQKSYVVLNFSNEDVPFKPLISGDLKLINSNVKDVNENTLTPYEGRVYLVE
ncbi:alpha-glucosidase [Wickerhamomyces ciferrii]|uniref:Alpha-glucosidase n=1 Tax=Wickerhamomyces ciferrii (strain ATCC 14091 / BCRC 22168 / CBS 111 / JCM 3599 / NBRC 0793 / NRRL Y-1031 F-60-10) TaxID=1206466 RepID=K0KJ29_WICCF|nr:alpha-glucosidase [Wickerhamomyces ciferrii]CCH41479.1 alpha-glucosidase [Wickerhamomyces ciferrii]